MPDLSEFDSLRGAWESWSEPKPDGGAEIVVGWLPLDDSEDAHHRVVVESLREARILRAALATMEAIPR